jgi:Holliday junction resolvase RusA-like endonuclease
MQGRTAVIKSKKALVYAAEFKQQAQSMPELFQGDVAIQLWIYYASRRPDLDESLILDLLQGVCYGNDRQVREKHVYWGLDRDNPRCEIEVWERA